VDVSTHARMLIQLAADEGILSSQQARGWLARLDAPPADRAPAEWLVEQGALTRPQLEDLQGRLRQVQQQREEQEATRIINYSHALTRNGVPSIPGYEVLDSLGGGGVGVVYRARREGSRQLVALKILRAGALATETQRLRFEREALALADLSHPGLVGVHDFGEVGGQLYYSMDLVEGTPLNRHIRERDLPRRDGLALMQRVCKAMAYAHQHGVIHRDLKPANILVERGGQPKILDFGVAKLTETRNGVPPLYATRDGEVLGTLGYMAPEQTLGRPNEIDTRTDVYALGVILYEVLTGRLPHGANGEDALGAMKLIREDPPVRPGKIDPTIDSDLETIILTALNKDKERRYQSAGAMAEDIGRYLAREPIVARRASAVYELRRLARRYRAVLFSATCAVALVAAVAAMAFFRVRAERNAALVARQQAEAAREAAEHATYCATINLADAKSRNGEFSWVSRLLQDCPERFRRWEWGYLHQSCHPELRLLLANPEPVLAATFGPDGSTVVGTTFHGTVKTWDLETGQSTVSSCRNVRVGRRTDGFSADGRRVAMARQDNGVGIWDVRTGRELALLEGHSDTVWSACFSPDGQRVATASKDGTARIWDADSGRELHVLAGHSGGVQGVAFSPDGQQAVTFAADRTARIWDAQAGRLLHVLEATGLDVSAVAFSPRGDRIATGSANGTVTIWSTGVGERLKTLKAHELPILWLAFRPEGIGLLTASGDGTARVWSTETGDCLGIFSGHGGPVMRAEFSPRGDRILTTGLDGSARLWDPRDVRKGLSMQWDSHHVMAFSPDGARTLTANWPNERGESGGHDCAIRSAETAERLLALVGHTHPLHSGAFSPHGRRAATLDEGGTVRTWDAETGDGLATFEALHYVGLHPHAWDPTGTRFVSVGPDMRVRVRDAQTGQELVAFGGPDACSAAFGPGGHRVVTTHMDWSIRVWDARTATEALAIQHPTGLCWLAVFSPDGGRIVSASEDRTARVLDAQSGEELAVLEGHECPVRSVGFSPDGARVVTCDRYGTCKVWDAESGRELLTLPGLVLPYSYYATFSPDGHRILTAGPGQMMVYTANPWRASLEVASAVP